MNLSLETWDDIAERSTTIWQEVSMAWQHLELREHPLVASETNRHQMFQAVVGAFHKRQAKGGRSDEAQKA